jgi:hypothetical protein
MSLLLGKAGSFLINKPNRMIKKILFYIIIAVALVSAAFVFNGNNNDVFSKSSLQISGDQRRTCGTMEYLEMQYRQDPSYRNRMEELEKYAEKYAREHQYEKDSRGIIIIPCVVHVVWNTPQQNISDDQILSQIDILNKDFRRLNSDTSNTPPPFKPLGADCQIEFRMARRDPSNSPSLGITRTQTSIVEFGQNIAVKFTSLGGHDA